MTNVAESAVVDVPQPDFGEGGVAVVVAPNAGAKLDCEAILAQLKTILAHFEVSKCCFSVLGLPCNAMGKMQTNLLRAQHDGVFSIPR